MFRLADIKQQQMLPFNPCGKDYKIRKLLGISKTTNKITA